MEAVAARAGVGKATVYRRYSGKAELVISAAAGLTETEAPPPDTGSLRDDVHALAQNLVHLLTRTPAGRCLPELVAALPRAPGLAAEHAAFLAGRRAATHRVVQRGVARGELAADVDAELVADLVAGPIFYRHLVSRARLDRAYAARVADAVLACVAPRVAATPV
jgi:AcrR family transcriptional regulator